MRCHTFPRVFSRLGDEHGEGDARTAVEADAPREPAAAGHLTGGPARGGLGESMDLSGKI